mgnify:CR=1 FL=1
MRTESKNPEELMAEYFSKAVNRAGKDTARREAFVRTCARPSLYSGYADAAAKERFSASGNKRIRKYIEGSIQALFGLAASLLIAVNTGTAHSRPLAKQLGDELVTQTIGSAFADLAKQLDDGIAAIIEGNK